jgi:hypothetical protein
MSPPYGFIHRSANGLHSSICMGCFRTAGQSPYSPALTACEMTHECAPSDLTYRTAQTSPISHERIVSSCIHLSPELELLLLHSAPPEIVPAQ